MSTHASEQTGLASFPLSPQQELLWELGAEAPGYRAQCAVEVPSGWTAAHLRGALDTVVRRHEVLRTVFVRPQGMRLPAQAVLDRLDPDWQVERVDALTDVDVDRLLADEVAFAFDLERGPIVRARHVSSTGGPGLLVLTLPSVTADAVSLVAMVGELAAALEEEGAPEVPEEPLQYADYAGWRNETLAERDAGAQGPDEDGVSPVLLFGRETTSVPSFSADRIRIPLADAVIAGIEGAAAALRTTPRLFAEACWHACVARVAGAEDLAAASVFDGRTHAELGGAVGPYAQSSPVTTRSDADTSLAELVDQVRRAAEQLAIRQDSLDASALARTSARCRIGFAAFDAGPVALRTPGNTVLLGVRTLFARSTRFDLQLCWIETAAGPVAELHSSPDAYTREDATRIASCFSALLASAVETPGEAVASLELTTAADRDHLVRELNRTEADFPTRCLHELFEDQAARTPERAAVRCGERTLSYRELNARANSVARELRGLGVAPGSTVALCMQRSVEMLVGVLGILKAGAAYVPLNYEHPRNRLEHQLGEADVRALVTEEEVADRVPAFAGPIVSVDPNTPVASNENAPTTAAPDNPVYVMYTSGSTGLPKGVEVTHRNLVNYATAIAERLSSNEADGGLQFGVVSAISTDLGNTGIFPPLISGGCVHLVEPAVAMDADRLATYAGDHRIDVLKITPSHLSSLLAGNEDASMLPRRWLVIGGEALSWDLVDQIRARRPELGILNHYGPTETTVGSCTFDVGTNVSAWRPATVPIGRPLPNTTTYILGPGSDPAPVGVAGELVIGGEGVARGYVNRPEETAQRFEADPFRPGERVYRTGDRARYLPDGSIEFLGRIDQQIKIRGFRVEPGEVEATLQRHPAIRQVAVLAREDGLGDPRLVGYVVASPEVGTDELQTFLSDTLPDYMIPSAFVSLDAMPLTPSGKIDRQSLPDPVAADAEREARYVAPRDDVERGLVTIWSELLQIERIGVHDDFFALGGHSLLATQVIMRVRRAYGDVPLQAMFIAPTVAGLAEAVRARSDGGS